MIAVHRTEDFAEVSDLLAAFLREIGEPVLDREANQRLTEAAAGGRIGFFVARKGDEAVGMCSLTLGFSTYKAAPFGVMEDVYVAEAWRGHGVFRLLQEAVIAYAQAQGCRSVIAGCSTGDVPMWAHFGYRSIGTMMAKDV